MASALGEKLVNVVPGFDLRSEPGSEEGFTAAHIVYEFQVLDFVQLCRSLETRVLATCPMAIARVVHSEIRGFTRGLGIGFWRKVYLHAGLGGLTRSRYRLFCWDATPKCCTDPIPQQPTEAKDPGEPPEGPRDPVRFLEPSAWLAAWESHGLLRPLHFEAQKGKTPAQYRWWRATSDELV